MTKIPDFSELTKKLDLQGIVDSVKSAIGTQTPPAEAPDGDSIAAEFVEIITALQQVTKTQSEQAKALDHLGNKLNALYKNVMAYKTPATEACSLEKPQPSSKAHQKSKE